MESWLFISKKLSITPSDTKGARYFSRLGRLAYQHRHPRLPQPFPLLSPDHNPHASLKFSQFLTHLFSFLYRTWCKCSPPSPCSLSRESSSWVKNKSTKSWPVSAKWRIKSIRWTASPQPTKASSASLLASCPLTTAHPWCSQRFSTCRKAEHRATTYSMTYLDSIWFEAQGGGGGQEWRVTGEDGDEMCAHTQI